MVPPGIPPMLSDHYLRTDKWNCAHPRVANETLVPGEPENIAMSVVLASMLHTTADFNAFQLVVESLKFDLSEPLILHVRNITIDGRYSDWELLIVDPAGMALCLDKKQFSYDQEDEDLFRLLKTLVLSCHLNLEMNLRAIQVDIGKWSIYRASGALSFLYYYFPKKNIYSLP